MKEATDKDLNEARVLINASKVLYGISEENKVFKTKIDMLEKRVKYLSELLDSNGIKHF